MKSMMLALTLSSLSVFAGDFQMEQNQPEFIRCFTHCGAASNYMEQVPAGFCAQVRLTLGCFCGTSQEIAQQMQQSCNK